MAEKNTRRDKDMDVLFKAILSLETLDECYDFFEDLCYDERTGGYGAARGGGQDAAERQYIRADRQKCRDQHSDHQPD